MASPIAFGFDGSADDAGVGHLAVRNHPVEHLAGAVDRRPFLVAGDEQADRAGLAGIAAVVLQPAERRGNEAGDGALHIDRATPPDLAVGQDPRERWMAPGRFVARGHYVRVSGEADVRAASTDAREQIVDIGRIGVLED